MRSKRKNIFQRIIQVANLPTDTQEQKRNKENLMLMASHFTIVGVIWGTLFLTNGLWEISCFPYSYTIISIISLVVLLKTNNFIFFRNVQLCLVLLTPFFIHLALGGFVPSSIALLWSIVCPMAALFFITVRQSVYWFSVYFVLIVIGYLIGDELSFYNVPSISESIINTMFLLNLGGVSVLIFLVQIYFTRNERALKEEVEKQNTLLEVQSDQLKELDKMKSNFFANISHEFRTPLTLIQGILDRRETPSQEDCTVMAKNADRLLQLINQLLDLAKLESGKMQLKKQTINLNSEARKIAQLFGSVAEMKGIQFRLNNHSILDGQVEAVLAELDPEQIHKVLTNLISNALKFCPEGGKIDINIKDGNTSVQLIFSNTGEDIPKEQLPLLFNRFHQLDSGSTRASEGTGIGLSLVHEIVSLHGGEISVSSENQLVRFEIFLPKGQLGPLAETAVYTKVIEPLAQNKPTPAIVEGKDQLKILVVEDYPDLRSFINRILSESYTVIESSNGEEGVQKALEEIPDLIISDIMMPKKDGNQLCAELKNHPATDHIPIILLTARAGKEDKFEGLDHGADDYLTKPFDESELLVRIRNLIQNRKKLQQKYQKEIWLKPGEVKVTSTQEKFLEQLKEVVEEHLSNETLTAEELARNMALSRSQLHRKLKALTNQSATEFIRAYRLERGAELLMQQFGNVSEIAYEVGFSSRTYFSSCFQKHFGRSPSEYIRS